MSPYVFRNIGLGGLSLSSRSFDSATLRVDPGTGGCRDDRSGDVGVSGRKEVYRSPCIGHSQEPSLSAPCRLCPRPQCVLPGAPTGRVRPREGWDRPGTHVPHSHTQGPPSGSTGACSRPSPWVPSRARAPRNLDTWNLSRPSAHTGPGEDTVVSSDSASSSLGVPEGRGSETGWSARLEVRRTVWSGTKGCFTFSTEKEFALTRRTTKQRNGRTVEGPQAGWSRGAQTREGGVGCAWIDSGKPWPPRRRPGPAPPSPREETQEPQRHRGAGHQLEERQPEDRGRVVALARGAEEVVQVLRQVLDPRPPRRKSWSLPGPAWSVRGSGEPVSGPVLPTGWSGGGHSHSPTPSRVEVPNVSTQGSDPDGSRTPMV